MRISSSSVPSVLAPEAYHYSAEGSLASDPGERISMELTQPRAGRPTREEAVARHEALLEVALDHFLEKGFEQATIEAIAQDARATKRTIYARYADKAALFHAAVG